MALSDLEKQLREKGDCRVKLPDFCRLVARHPCTIKRAWKRGEISLIKTNASSYDLWLSEAARYLRQKERGA